MKNGILPIDKPKNFTSFSTVSLFRKITNIKTAGHTGTLDPNATGMLLIMYGEATKLMRYLVQDTKTYRAHICLGKTTDTQDIEGTILEDKSTIDINLEKIEAVLKNFSGMIEQKVPMYSAVKHEGKRMYELARKGYIVDTPIRTVNIYYIDIKSFDNPNLVIEVKCSKGTYLRTLAHDVGIALNCGAYLSDLRRLKCGELYHMHTLQELENDIEKNLSNFAIENAFNTYPKLSNKSMLFQHKIYVDDGFWQFFDDELFGIVEVKNNVPIARQIIQK